MIFEPKGRPRIEAGKEQEILRLRLEGKSYNAIARVVGVSASTAYAVIANAAERSKTPERRRRDTTLHARIITWRVRHGWTVAAVARKLGISDATVMLHCPSACGKPR